MQNNTQNTMLKEKIKETENTVSSNTTTGTSNESEAASANGSKLTISSPIGAEVYMDGSYIGIVPVSVKKTIGVHVITLRQTGYETRSYTINVTDLTSDENMSFSALVKEEEEKEEEKESSSENEEEESSEDNNNNQSVSSNG